AEQGINQFKNTPIIYQSGAKQQAIIDFQAIVDDIGSAGALGYLELILSLKVALFLGDPPVPQFRVDTRLPVPIAPADNVLPQASLMSTASGGSATGTMGLRSIAVSNQLIATWSSQITSRFQAQSINASAGTIEDSSGNLVGSGTVALVAAAALPVRISGSD